MPGVECRDGGDLPACFGPAGDSKDNEWCTTTLVANGNRMAVWVNGCAVVDWEDTRKPDERIRGRGQRTKAGHISLQGHDPTTDVSFRNIQVV